MPELPEAEVVRRGLQRWVAGRTIESVEIYDPRSVRRQIDGPASFIADLTGARILDAVRRGKFLWLPLGAPEAETSPAEIASPRHALMAHLGMSGQMLVKDADLPDERHLRIRLTLSPACDPDQPDRPLPRELRFVDQRIFGGMFVDSLRPTDDGAPGGQSLHGYPLVPEHAAHIGRDPLDPAFDIGRIQQRFKASRTGIKRALLNQGLVSGIGNIYADEALWEAKLHYEQPTNTLGPRRSRRILEAVQAVMGRALEAGGTSFDSLYVNVNGESGYFTRFLHSYGREGKPCHRCGALIVRERFMNRSSYFCPKCQRRR
ncbi:bifunctional DNA-formamidopyrimidine glycosylase/DNA-(apurinic or apyrimidinic site) lyase [Kocuria coralli]|uniref:Formamidopyrimidine-DNA glycosylase n=1 Tax=Kocuria coralli TaxID=1461025 RepID=A0A5J5L176_9MICC|nr:bifunctional DNA-formamidopyrimidine glycosylase/DNA-(apurinic or apyrimidinic site) lyase [Kocuria coralli]KAA9395704.1 bifunctional DNA-formamidopyrimidine glycosylase/DNA-(apurinic or apyrimidinic site) lyase [Kocuria coralli]